MSKDQGWIKLHRKFLNWEWFDDPKMVKMFIFLLLSANHSPYEIKGVQVQRGQYLTSYRKLAFALGYTVKTVRTCLNKLVTTREVALTARAHKRAQERAHPFTIITICNYESYQTENGFWGTEKGTKSGNNIRNIKKSKNDNKVECIIIPTPNFSNLEIQRQKEEDKKDIEELYQKALRMY